MRGLRWICRMSSQTFVRDTRADIVTIIAWVVALGVDEHYDKLLDNCYGGLG